MSDDQLPSLPSQAKNSAKMIADVIQGIMKNNPIFVDEFEQKRRYDICQACEYFVASSHRCKKCGCFMKKKVEFTAAKCPVKKW